MTTLLRRAGAGDADLAQADVLVVQAVLAAGASPLEALREVDHPVIRDAVAAVDAGGSLGEWLAADDGDAPRAPAAVSLVRALSLSDRLGSAAGPAADAVLDGLAAAERGRRLTRTRSAQAVHSARFLIGLPPVAGLGLLVLDPAVRQFWLAGSGLLIVLVAIVLIGSALLWIRRLLAHVADAAGNVDPLADTTAKPARAAATVTVAVVGAVAGGVLVGLLGAAVVWATAPHLRQRLVQPAEEAWPTLSPADARQLPTVEAIELLALALSSSAPLPTACALVGEACAGPTGRVFDRVAAGLHMGADPDEAFPEPLAEVARLLSLTRRWGAPSAKALRLLAADLRTRAASAAEEAAERLAVRLVFPTTLLLVPAFGLLVVVPLAVSMLSGLQLGG
ncbi:type II secretion system F family protein [Euzebya tangerina]|uniref:type II secretion system F family protein n=1 Tax=Euzebya tangerina TaxID=591198 RepID=UPI0013C33BF2|nr:type II secretion system F family protein [Euzebya tangerina]